MLNEVEKKFDRRGGENDKLQKGTWLSASSLANQHRRGARTPRIAESLVNIIGKVFCVNLYIGGAWSRLALGCMKYALRNCNDWATGAGKQTASSISAME